MLQLAVIGDYLEVTVYRAICGKVDNGTALPAPDVEFAVTFAENSTRTERTGSARRVVGNVRRYPALHRLEAGGWIKSKWGASESNRRAKFYTLTAAGGGS